MTRGTDFYCRLDGCDIWDLKDQFEPVLMFICLPHNPKPVLSERLLAQIRRTMLGTKMQEIPEVQRRDLLCKLLLRSWELLSM